MAERSHFDSNLPSKVFTMSPEEENYRRKLQRIGSTDISTAVPVLLPSFSKRAPSVFAFAATKNEQSHSDLLIVATRKGTSRLRCRVCNRPKVTKASSTTGKVWPLRRIDDTGQVNPFSTSSYNSKQLDPSRFSSVDTKFVDGFQPHSIPAASTVMACPNLISKPFVALDNQNYSVKKLEDTDQIVKKASDMVKLLESHIAALQLSAQSLKAPSERILPVQASPMNSYPNFKNMEPVNPFMHKLDETSMSQRPPLYQASLPASPALTFPCPTLNPTPTPSYSPYQLQIPAITCLCQKPSYSQNHQQGPPPSQIPQPSQIPTVSSIPSQKTSSTPPSHNVKNIVKRLESLNLSPCPYNRTPNGFTFPPLRTRSKRDKHNMYRTPTKEASAVSSSSGFNKLKSQTNIPSLSRKVKHQTSKLIKPHKAPPHQQYSSDPNDDSGSSVSSSSWTTTQQSGSEQSEEYSYSSAESSRTPESEYSTETTTTSSVTSPINRRCSKQKPSVSTEKPISRLRRITKKIGLIFHHHHHHHHHHHDEEENLKLSSKKLNLLRHPSTAEKKASGAVVKRRDEQGHFRALVDGLMRRVRLRKRKKKSEPLKEIERLKKKVQFGKVGKRRRGLKLPKPKFKAVIRK